MLREWAPALLMGSHENCISFDHPLLPTFRILNRTETGRRGGSKKTASTLRTIILGRGCYESALCGIGGNPSRAREPYGENRNNCGRGRRDLIPVVVNEVTDISEDRARNGGAVFWGALTFCWASAFGFGGSQEGHGSDPTHAIPSNAKPSTAARTSGYFNIP